MKETNRNAFPITNETTVGEQGLTMLDYFAATIIGGMVSAPCDSISQDLSGNVRGGSVHSIKEAVRVSYMIAKAMIEERQNHI